MITHRTQSVRQVVYALFCVFMPLFSLSASNIDLLCLSDAGDLNPTPLITNFSVCLGSDLTDAGDASVVFSADYSAADETDPGLAGFSYLFLLADSNGSIVDISVSGDFDFSVLTVAGDYGVFGFSYDTVTNTDSASDYLNMLTGDADTNDIAQIETDEAAGVICLDLDNQDTSGNPVVISLIEGPSITALSFANPTTCAGTEGSISFILGETQNTTSNYNLNYDLDGNAQSVNLTSLESTPASGIFDSLVIENAGAGTYDNFTITLTSQGCAEAIAQSAELTDPVLPTPSLKSSTDPSACNGTDGTFTLEGLTPGEDYIINYTLESINQSTGTLTADANGEIIVENLSPGIYNAVSAIENSTQCQGGNINTTLSNPAPPTLNPLADRDICAAEAAAFDLTTIQAEASTDAGSFTWFDNDPAAGGQVIPTPESVAFSSDTVFHVVFQDATSNCTATTSLSLQFIANAAISNVSTGCATDVLSYTLSFTANPNAGDTLSVESTGGFDFTSNLQSNDNVNFSLSGIPNDTNVIISLKRDNPACPGAEVQVAGISCCAADAGIITPNTAQVICEGEDSPVFSATQGNNSPNPTPTTTAISEVRLDNPSNNTPLEFFEISGTPGTGLSDYTYVVIGTVNGNHGIIENVTALSGTIPATGYYTVAPSGFAGAAVSQVADLNFRDTSQVTHLLVQNFTANLGDDLDSQDDGVLDATPWTNILSELAFLRNAALVDSVYSSNTIGGTDFLPPAHVYFSLEENNYTTTVAPESPGTRNTNPAYTYLWLLTQDNSSNGGTANDIAAVNTGSIDETHQTLFSNLDAGAYCVYGVSYFGTAGDFNAMNFTSASALADSIASGAVCADFDINSCTPLSVAAEMMVGNFTEGDCTSLDQAGTYEISFTISGGLLPITINGEDILSPGFPLGQISGAGSTADPYVFTSNPIASLANYSYSVSDAATNCSPDVTYAGGKDCDPCTGYAAPNAMNSVTECADATIVVSPQGGGKPGVTSNGYRFYYSDPAAGNAVMISQGTSLVINDQIVPTTGVATTIYITSYSESPVCESEAITLTLTRNPLPLVSPVVLTECVEANGQASFTIKNADEMIDLNGGNTVTYHLNQSDADAGTAPLSSPYTASNGTVLIARVQDANGCYATTELSLETMLCEVSISDPCSCRDNPANVGISGNATTNADGQFNETISVDAPNGQTWFIQSVTGLFDNASAQPPAAPTPFVTGMLGETLVENDNGDGTSTYTLEGLHIDAQGYEITVTNGADVLSINNRCYYPTPAMLAAPSSVCLFTAPFTITGEDVNGGVADLAVFELRDAGNTIVQSAIGTQITLDPQALGTGTYTLEFIFDAGASGQDDITDPGCTQSISQSITIQETPSGLACNDNVQISVGDNCASTILPDMILEGNYGCEDDYEVRIWSVFNENLGDTTTPDMIGESYAVRVYHLPTNNYCVGSIIIEDKEEPEFSCSPLPVDLMCWEDFNTVPAPVAFDNCTAAPEVQQTSQVISNNAACDPVTITRTFTAFDASGNQAAECTQVIRLLSPALPDFPEDITFTCEQYNAFPNIIDTTALNPSITDSDLSDDDIDVADNTANTVLQNTGAGVPDVNSGIYCKYAVTSDDDVLASCGNTIKILRTWVVINWCTNSLITSDINGDDNIQLIEVIDNKAPVLSRTPFTVNTNVFGSHPQPCLSTEFLPGATVFDNCSDIEEMKIFTPVGEADYLNGTDGSNGGFIPQPGLTLGFHDITYTATDVCGNTKELIVTIEVIDESAPTPVCDLITTTVLNQNGLAVVNAEVFDDGSNDNCGVDYFEVRKLTDACGIPGNTTFGPTVSFCCADAAQDFVDIEVRVVDYFNNSNICSVQVIVEENTAPSLQFCPGAQNITCDFYNNNLELALNSGDMSVLSSFGTASFADACGLEITENFTENVNSCGEGSIVRTFSAVDDFGNTSPTCTQTINVVHVSDFVVEFPEDIDYTCQPGEDPTASGNFGEPLIFFDDCEMVATSFEDMTFDIVDDACFKIFRTWTVINWCVYDDFSGDTVVEDPESALPGGSLDPGADKDDRTFRDGLNAANFPNAVSDGYIQYVQVIKVTDDVAPVINNPGFTEYCITENACSTSVTLPTPTADDCSQEVEFTAVSILGTGFGPFDNVSPGVYDITYSASDNCGNSSNISFQIEVVDCKAPTPYCNGGLVVELMPMDTDQDGDPDTGEVTISADSFDAGSFDNCSDVQISFTSDITQTTQVYNCDSIGTRAVFIWVTDEEGNQDVCQTFVQIESVDNVCEPTAPVIAGYIEREDGQGVLEVEVMVSGNVMNMDMSNDIGYFEVENLEEGYDYSVIPSKNEEHDLGVTTLDLVFIRRHVLTEQLLDSPYKIIAADANNNQNVTTADIVLIKQLILNNIQEFPNNSSWRFVDKYHNFSNPLNPWETDFPEFKSYNNLDSPVYAADFTAIKIGDVNNSAVVNFNSDSGEERSAETVFLRTQDRKVKAGESFTIQVETTADLDLTGMQWTLDFDPNALNFIQIEGENILQSGDFGLSLLSHGLISSSFLNERGTKLANESLLFEMSFIALQDGYLSDFIEINSRHLKAEAYDSNYKVADVQLTFFDTEESTEKENVVLLQNQPNPFRDETNIRFYLPENQTYSLTIFDTTGKELFRKEEQGQAGLNSLHFNQNQLKSKGLLYYRLETKAETLTRKMLVL